MAGNARHSEKNRRSSCEWADRVAGAVLSQYVAVVPGEVRDGTSQTVVAGIVLLRLPEEEVLVASLGMGTKYMWSASPAAASERGSFLRDCHAEVLARRGFKRFLIAEMACEGKSRWLTWKGIRFGLQPGVSVHFYSSSMPCGNASVKRWGKGSNLEMHGVVDPLKIFSGPAPHVPIHIVQRDQGQIALSAKVNGLTQSCSDKIAVWNVLGLQGAMLSPHVEPVYMSTCVIGRKCSEPHARRALCCRLQELKAPHCLQTSGPYKLNHPWILCTSVKLDPKVVTQNDKASFEQVLCAAWAVGMPQAELLNGSCGMQQDGSVSVFCGNALRNALFDCSRRLPPPVKVDVEREAVSQELFSTVFAGWIRN